MLVKLVSVILKQILTMIQIIVKVCDLIFFIFLFNIMHTICRHSFNRFDSHKIHTNIHTNCCYNEVTKTLSIVTKLVLYGGHTRISDND